MEIIKPGNSTFNALAVRLGKEGLQKAFIISQLSYTTLPGQDKRPGAYKTMAELEKEYPYWPSETREKYFNELAKKGILTIFEDNTRNARGFVLHEKAINMITKTNLEGLTLKSKYAMKIYEMLVDVAENTAIKSNDVTMAKTIEIDKLREMTETQNKYTRLSTFKDKVIDTALKDINRNTNYQITATPCKNGKGKAVTGFRFEIANLENKNI